jgi:ABC-type oligopeptide transport system ATPase subunit
MTAVSEPGLTDAGTAAGGDLYSVEGLYKYFPIKAGLLQRTVAQVQAVDNVSFTIERGETVGLVGESGCGKTTTGRLLLRLVEPTKGRLVFDGRDITNIPYDEMKRLRGEMQIIFQDPYASLNPRLPVGDIIGEGLYNLGMHKSADRELRVADMLERVGLRKYYINRYPHEFSGGQRQRIGIARALVLRPRFVVADEPVSALDVSIQSQVLNLLKDLQDEFKLTYLFISHNLQVVQHVSDKVGVMYLGKLVEMAPAKELYRAPKHPYTQALLSAIPLPDRTGHLQGRGAGVRAQGPRRPPRRLPFQRHLGGAGDRREGCNNLSRSVCEQPWTPTPPLTTSRGRSASSASRWAVASSLACWDLELRAWCTSAGRCAATTSATPTSPLRWRFRREPSRCRSSRARGSIATPPSPSVSATTRSETSPTSTRAAGGCASTAPESTATSTSATRS